MAGADQVVATGGLVTSRAQLHPGQLWTFDGTGRPYCKSVGAGSTVASDSQAKRYHDSIRAARVRSANQPEGNGGD